MYRKVKRLYDLGLYTAEQVKDFADRGKITLSSMKKSQEKNMKAR